MKKTLDTQFAEMSSFIAASRATIARGEMLELHGMDEQVRGLCQLVLSLPELERQHYLPRMDALLASLRVLGEEMTKQKEVVANELRNLSGHKKANAAYLRTEASDKKDNK